MHARPAAGHQALLLSFSTALGIVTEEGEGHVLHTHTSAGCCAQPLTDSAHFIFTTALSPLHDDGTEAQRGPVLLRVMSNWQNWNKNPALPTSKVPSTSALVGLEDELPSTPTCGRPDPELCFPHPS